MCLREYKKCSLLRYGKLALYLYRLVPTHLKVRSLEKDVIIYRRGQRTHLFTHPIPSIRLPDGPVNPSWVVDLQHLLEAQHIVHLQIRSRPPRVHGT